MGIIIPPIPVPPTDANPNTSDINFHSGLPQEQGPGAAGPPDPQFQYLNPSGPNGLNYGLPPSGPPKVEIGSEFQQGGIDGAAWTRREALISPDQLVNRFLFGIPLYSAVPDPITGVRARLTPENIKDAVFRAVGRIELESGITISPVTRVVKLPFDRNEYLQMGFFLVPYRPILRVDWLTVMTSDNQLVYQVPNEWVDAGNFQRGQINIVPLQPAYLNAGFVPSQSAGGAAFLSILGAKGWIASYWGLKYTTGFDTAAGIPVAMNELIGCEAAIDLLNLLAATNRVQSYSLGVDGLSQSASTPGPQVYQFRIEQLLEQKKILLNKFKALYSLKIFSSNV